ncbi:hypothetical protein [Paraburkholderia terrae]|uniref:hypothetical protein n=1 Tax=Paraburkholderia terrae TaxID=311230 RepID=UPI001E5E9C5F|nr:hypothetical protein [Paraburkholderia terrae]
MSIPTEKRRSFHDVFLSCRHHDAWHIDQLEKRIASFGFELFRDTNFPNAYHQSAAQTMRPRPASRFGCDL